MCACLRISPLLAGPRASSSSPKSQSPFIILTPVTKTIVHKYISRRPRSRGRRDLEKRLMKNLSLAAAQIDLCLAQQLGALPVILRRGEKSVLTRMLGIRLGPGDQLIDLFEHLGQQAVAGLNRVHHAFPSTGRYRDCAHP